jgi:hypothetical protein
MPEKFQQELINKIIAFTIPVQKINLKSLAK